MAPSLGVELTPVGVRDAGEIERAIIAFARGSNGGLIMVGPISSVQRHRDLIVALAARHRLPAVYPNRVFVTGGGPISYATDPVDQYRRAAGYGRNVKWPAIRAWGEYHSRVLDRWTAIRAAPKAPER